MRIAHINVCVESGSSTFRDAGIACFNVNRRTAVAVGVIMLQVINVGASSVRLSVASSAWLHRPLELAMSLQIVVSS